MGSPLEDLFAFLLGHATQHSEHFALPVFLLELLQAVEHLLFGFIANAASVVKDEIGGLRLFDLRITLGHQRPDHLLGIVHVHLATEGLNVEGLHLGRRYFYCNGWPDKVWSRPTGRACGGPVIPERKNTRQKDT